MGDAIPAEVAGTRFLVKERWGLGQINDLWRFPRQFLSRHVLLFKNKRPRVQWPLHGALYFYASVLDGLTRLRLINRKFNPTFLLAMVQKRVHL